MMRADVSNHNSPFNLISYFWQDFPKNSVKCLQWVTEQNKTKTLYLFSISLRKELLSCLMQFYLFLQHNLFLMLLSACAPWYNFCSSTICLLLICVIKYIILTFAQVFLYDWYHFSILFFYEKHNRERLSDWCLISYSL